MNRPDSRPPVDRLAVLAQYEQHVNSGLAKLARFANLPVEVRSEGNLVYNEQGEAFLNCGGYSVFLLGHRHPAVTEAVKAQIDRHPLTTRVLLNPELAQAATDLAEIAPTGLEYVCFTNSGAEAVEVGLKLARLNGKRKLIAAQGGFHGKTLGALSVTGRAHFQEPFAPLLADVEFVPYGDASALETALRASAGESCVILEPVQGEAGVIIPPEGYLREVTRLCSLHGALLILDEIQTGLGRLGVWWGCEREGVVPDILLTGKVLSGGVVPVGAAVTSAEIYAGINRDPFLHSSTFAGNPLAMSAVIATIETIKREDLVSKADRLGKTILESLKAILGELCPGLVVEVRGVGLLIGVEFTEDHIAADFILELMQRKVVLSNSLNSSRVARLTPPALLTESDLEWLYKAVRGAAASLSKRYAPALVQG
ncbi:MAG TPA: aminotransferase class III-fold pyridoxal phosphate-dependent enzyme [Dehalococcoidia bacterium]|nr:aminotransferase class III-fold pyridoxal phosphate-dependent enzyme [Dehalococcoidia bacterium]